jgi:hypothetical protein
MIEWSRKYECWNIGIIEMLRWKSENNKKEMIDYERKLFCKRLWNIKKMNKNFSYSIYIFQNFSYNFNNTSLNIMGRVSKRTNRNNNTSYLHRKALRNAKLLLS